MEMRKSHCWNEASSRKISMSVWFYRKFRSWTQPLGSPQGLEMTASALSGIQQYSSSLSYWSSSTWCYTHHCLGGKQLAPLNLYLPLLVVGSFLWAGEEMSWCPWKWWQGSDITARHHRCWNWTSICIVFQFISYAVNWLDGGCWI